MVTLKDQTEVEGWGMTVNAVLSALVQRHDVITPDQATRLALIAVAAADTVLVELQGRVDMRRHPR
jgi:hypothetical protein